MDETNQKVELTKAQIRILRDGLCVWNTIVIDSLTERGRLKLHAAQDLIERIWNQSK